MAQYREIARDGLDRPEVISTRRIVRWYADPQVFIHDVTVDTGRRIEEATLDFVRAIVAESIYIWSDARYRPGSMTVGPYPQLEGNPPPGHLVVLFYDGSVPFYGPTVCGSGGGAFNLRARQMWARVSLRIDCAKNRRTIAHEVGHAMGFGHHSFEGVLGRSGGESISTLERRYSKIVYSRPFGNLDIDKDPDDFSISDFALDHIIFQP